jgi:hypothetical protein
LRKLVRRGAQLACCPAAVSSDGSSTELRARFAQTPVRSRFAAGIIGADRSWTVLMLSVLSVPSRCSEVGVAEAMHATRAGCCARVARNRRGAP